MFINYINNFRGIAIIMVIFIHTLLPFKESMDPLLWKSLFALFQDSTVLFVFVSGFLFQHLLEKYEFKKYIQSKISYVFIPYLLLSTPGIFWTNIKTNDFSLFLILENVLTGSVGVTMGTYWFIPMIILFFISSPLFAMVDKHPKSYLILPVLFIISTFIERDGWPYQNFIHFLPIYLFGMFTSHFKIQIIPLLKKFGYLIFAIYLTLLVLDVLNLYTNYEYSPLSDNGFLRMWSKVLLCCLLINLLQSNDHVFKDKFDIFARFSFGLFFIQGYVISTLIKITRVFFGTGTIFHYISFTILTMAVSLSLLWCTKKVLRSKSRYFIGM